MKNHLAMIVAVTAFVSFALSLPGVAQKRALNFGPEAGVSISHYGQDAPQTDFKAGAIGGFFLTYDLQNRFGVTGKALYSQKGATFTSNGSKQTLNYLEVPVIGRFFLNKNGKLRPNIFLGPSLGIMTSVSNQASNEERVELGSYKPYYNTFDFGVTGGVGFNFKISYDTYFIVDGRYTYGLSDVTKAAGIVNNNSIAVTAGISFRL